MALIRGESGSHVLNGWEEVDCWATENWPSWKTISDKCRSSGIGETDMLKLLATAMLREAVTGQQEACEALGALNPASVEKECAIPQMPVEMPTPKTEMVEFRVKGRSVVGTRAPGALILQLEKQTVEALGLRVSDAIAVGGKLHFITKIITSTALSHDLIHFARFS